MAVDAADGAFACLRADLERYFVMAQASTRWERFVVVCGAEGIWALIWFRLGQYLRRSAPAPVRVACRPLYAVVHRFLRMAVGIHLFPETSVGPGLYIGHYGGIWISPQASLGANCNINHQVTIGVAGRDRGAPTIGDRVWVGPGAIISGPITVGSDAVVGANSLVVTHVPSHAVVIGVPGRVVSEAGSAKLVQIA